MLDFFIYTLLSTGNYMLKVINKSSRLQAWRERKRQARGHHSPSSIQGEWLAIDDKNNILASLCLASYLAVNWLQKLETKHCVYYTLFLFLCVCVCVFVCVCMVSQVDLSITKQNCLFVRCQSLSHIPNTSFAMFKSVIMEVELDDGGKHGKTPDGGT